MRFSELNVSEAPLPGDWDDAQFSPTTSFKQMVAYAKERATQLGKGSSRVAFEIPYQGRRTVLKVALNSKGLAQNAAEAMLLDDSYISSIGITIPLIDYDTANGDRISWIHTEFANKITQKQLERFFDGVSMTAITTKLDQDRNPQARLHSYNMPDTIFDNENYQKLQDLVLSGNIPAGDFSRKANWGLYNSQPVIIDLGYTTETQKLYR
jgi:hypothetical protein